MIFFRRTSIMTLLALAGACSSEGTVGSNAWVAGTYAVNITNGKNTCVSDLGDWVEGNSSSNIPLSITQTDDKLMAKVEGVAAIIIGFLHGTNDYTGSVAGNAVDLSVYGTVAKKTGACSYTWNGNLRATLQGDYLSGTLRYFPAGNGSPDCPKCAAEQMLNGSRPPGGGARPDGGPIRGR